MKVSTNKMIIYLLTIIIILDFQVFHIVKIDDLIFKMLEIVFSIFCFFFCLLKGSDKIERNKYGGLYFYLLFTLMFIFAIQLFYSVGVLGNSPYEFFAESYRYLLLLNIVPLTYIMNRACLREDFFRHAKRIVFIQYIASAFALAILMRTGINITNNNFSYRSIGSIPVSIYTENPIMALVMLYCIYETLNSREWKIKIRNLIFVSLGLLHSILIVKTRATLLAFLGAAFVMVMIPRDKSGWRLLFTALSISGAVIFCSTSTWVKHMFDFTGGRYASSNSAHIEAIVDCWNYFTQHMWVGAGIGLDWPVSYCDAGVVGLLANIGLGAFIVFIFPMLRNAGFILRQKITGSGKDITLLAGFTAYAFLTAVTLILTDDERMLSLAFVLALSAVVIKGREIVEFG